MADQMTMFGPDAPRPARGKTVVAQTKTVAIRDKVRDSYQNFSLQLGQGTDNALSGSTYGFNPVTRIRTLLEWIHRGTWLGGVAVDLVADDMTRAGIEINAEIDPEEVDELQNDLVATGTWDGINDTTKWGRLYGGAIGVILIDGADPKEPLRIDGIGRDTFRGVLSLDRWMVEADQNNLVTDYGPELGNPKYYRVVADAPAFRNQRIHHTRVLRVEGIRLPYWQRMMENMWGLSVIERLYDRMVAFDSATTGAAQLAYKSYVRQYKIENLREILAAGAEEEQALIRQVDMMRRFQSIEGITLIDAKDDFGASGFSGFAGMSDIVNQLGEQLAGALQIPLTRLFGQSPAGMNATGESDLRTYYDGINQQQNRTLKIPLNRILRVSAKSKGIKLDKDFAFAFRPLWQLSEAQKAEVAGRDAQTVLDTNERGLISDQTALKELKQQSKTTGRFTNITDKMIEDADDQAGLPELGAAGMPPAPGEEGEGGKDLTGGAGGKKAGGASLANPRKVDIPGKGDKTGDRGRARDRLPISEIHGLQIAIENPKGSVRSGAGWRAVMPADYGYIRRVGSAEGPEEWLDCFVGPDLESRDVFVIDAVNPATGQFDEHKVMLGFTGERAAIDCFRRAYDDGGAKRIGAVTATSFDEPRFHTWLTAGDKTRPMAGPILRAV